MATLPLRRPQPNASEFVDRFLPERSENKLLTLEQDRFGKNLTKETSRFQVCLPGIQERSPSQRIPLERYDEALITGNN